jgi:hypothetical protein
MSDALLTRIAEGIEKLIGLAGTVKAEKPAKAAKAVAADPTPAAAVTSAPASAPVATVSAAAQPAATAAGSTGGSPDLMTQTANAVIDLANNYSRDAAVEEMAKFGAQKVSQVKAADLSALLNNVGVRIAAEKAKKANESLV